ncbi:restriction endonuclease [Streptomyces sp. NPDC102467]|uniref:restriction endonuclease n=1 Tax=Streptomyces sp. NPDC102467 TaxID=3366179 RepID=UPI0037F72EF3
MINETVLLESKTLRDSVRDHTTVLDKVKTLSLLPDDTHVTTAMVAVYFEVAETVINNLLSRHRKELESNGLHVLRGPDLQKYQNLTVSFSSADYPQRRSSLALWSRRAVLNVAMLLRESDVARRVRTYLLDMEYLARTQPADTPATPAPDDLNVVDAHLDQRIDQRIAHTLGKTVVPMFNALIETSSEHRRELLALRAGVQHVERRLRQHHARLRRLEGPLDELPLTKAMAAMDAMNGRQFEHHIAMLLRRDGCTDVVVQGGPGDRGIDITALTPDGRRIAVQCKRFAPYLSIHSPHVQKFIGASKVLRPSEVALYVATCPFTPEALNIADDGGVTPVHRGLLDEWSTGAPLQILG